MRILVVEDDEALNTQIAEALRESGYVVDTALDGEEGHFLGDTEPYDAVVLDIGLPQMDGISVLESWRREKESRDPAFVWLRSLRPPGVPLGSPQRVVIPTNMPLRRTEYDDRFARATSAQ